MKVKSLKRVVFPFLIVAAAVAVLSASLIAYANPGSAPANGEYTYSQEPFSEEYSIGYFCLSGGDATGMSWYDGENDGTHTWNVPGWYNTNTTKNTSIYIDYADGVNMNGVTYDVRQYVWQTNCSYYLIMTNGAIHAEGANKATNNQVHCEYHFYPSGTLANASSLTEDELKAKEVTFRGVMRFTDMDINEGYSFEQGLVNDNVWLYSLTNVKKDTSGTNKWLGTWENGNNGQDEEREMMWVEVTGSADKPLKFTYWANHKHGSGVNYQGNTVKYEIVKTDNGGIKLDDAPKHEGIHCATYGTYTLVTAKEMAVEGYLFSGWYKEDTLATKAADSVVVSSDQTYYGTYYNLPDVKLTVNKDVEGKVAASTKYTFELKDSKGNLVDTVTTTGSGTADFKDIKYTGTGTYTYTVTEVIPDDAENAAGIKYSAATDEQKQAGGFVKDGVTYGANNVADITVTVSEDDNKQGQYITTVEVTKNGTVTGTYTKTGDEVCEATVNFTNAYNTEGTLTAGSIQVSKNLTGRDWTDKDSFTFQIAKGTYTAPDDTSYTVDEADYPMPSPTEITATQKNQEPSFGEMKYTIPGTYTYTIKETGYDASSTDLSYDSTTYTVTVSVVDDGKGNLTATVASVVDSSNIAAVDNAITFTNSKPVKTASTHDDEQAGSTVKVGQEITYTIAFDNTSDAKQTIDVYDSIPQHTTYTGSADVTVTVNGQTFDLNSNGSIYESKGSDGKVSSISVQLLEVPAHASGTVSFKVTVDESAVQGLDLGKTTNTIVNDKATVQIGTDGPRVEANPTTTEVKTGSLTVDKVVETRDGSDLPESEQGKKFTVFVYARDLGENALEGSYSVSVGGTAEQKSFTKVAADATGTDASYVGYGKMELELAGGQSAVISGLPEGASWTVVEQVDEGTRYETSYTKNHNILDGPVIKYEVELPKNSGGVSVNGSSITITNTYTPEVPSTKDVKASAPGANGNATGTAAKDAASIDGQIVGVGEIIVYTIDWTNDAVDNDGKAAVADITISDSIPAGTAYVDGSAKVYDEGGDEVTPSTENGISVVAPEGDATSGIVTWTLKDRDIGESGYVSFAVRVLDIAVETGTNSIVNEDASVTLAVENGPTTTKDPGDTTNYVPEKEEQADKRTVEGDVDVLTYTAEFMATSTSHELTDELYPGVEYVSTKSLTCDDTSLTVPQASTSTSGTGDEAQQTITWDLTGLTPGEMVTLTFKVKLAASAELTEVDNTIAVDGHKSNVVASPIPVKTASIWSDEDASEVKVGDLIVYKIAFKNTTGAETTVSVKDTIPTNTSFSDVEPAVAYVDGSPVSEPQLTIDKPSATSNEIVFTIDDVPADATGYVQFVVRVNQSAVGLENVDEETGELNPIVNTGMVGFGEDDPSVWYETNETKTKVSTGDLTVSKSVVGKDDAADEFTIAVYAKNGMNTALEGKYSIGDNETVEFKTTTDVGYVNYGKAELKLKAGESITIEGLPKGSTFTVVETSKGTGEDASRYAASYVYTDAEGTAGTATTDKASGNIAGDSQSVAVTNTYTPVSTPVKTVATSAAPTITDASGQSVGVGDVLTYTVNWKNDAVDANGAATAAKVAVTDSIPAGTAYVGDSAKIYDADGTEVKPSTENGMSVDAPDADATSGTVSWTLGEQAANASGTVTFQVRVLEPEADSLVYDAITNTATVTIGEGEGADEKTTKTIENPRPGKTATKVDSTGAIVTADEIQVGQEITYTVGYENTESAAATVYVRDTIPADTQLTSIANGGVAYDENGQAITDASGYANASYVMWKIENVPAAGGNGSEGTVSFKVKVLESAVADAVDGVATITNTAEVGIGIGENDPAYYSKTNTTETDVRTGDLTLSKAIVGGDAAKVFSFDVEVKDAGGNALAGTYSYEGDGSVEGAAGGKVTFASGKATVKLVGGQSVTIAGLPEGATYSVSEQKEAGWTATVVVTDPAAASDEGTDSAPTDSEVDVADDAGAGAGTLLSASSIDDSTAAAAIGTGTIGAGAASTVAFTNTYGIDETGAKVDTSTLFSKAISGRAWTDTDKFTFTLTGVDGAPIRTSATAESETSRTTDVTSAGTAADAKVTFGFGELWYTASDLDDVAYAADGTRTKTFTYEVTEKDGGTTTDGLEYSSAKATLTITIKDDGAGNLTAATAGSVVNGEFVNKYTSSIGYSALVDINFTNKLTGRDMAAGDYAFTVTADEETAKKLGLTTEENGHDSPASTSGVTTATVSLHDSLVTFTQDDADKTYSFTIAETKVPGTSGYVNDTTPRKVEVKVTDDHAGTLTVTTSVDGTVVSTVKTGDTTVEPVTIPFENFYSNEPGYIGGEGEGAARIDATKTLTGNELVGEDFSFSVTNAKDSSGTVLATGTNDESGVITFDEIKYTTESLNADYEAKLAERDVTDGVYTYTYVYQVAEDTADLPDGVAAKTSSFQITVDVVDKGDGSALEVGITYPAASDGNLAFVNAYGESATDSVTVAGTKALANDVPQTVVTQESIAGKYTFTLTGVDEDGNAAPLPEKTEASNDAAGNVTFGDIVYTVENVWGDDGSAATDDDGDGDGGDSDGDGGESEADESQGDAEAESGATQAQTLGSARTKTFTYTVTETGDVSGITNDSESSKTFTVTVTDDGNGAITAVASSDGSLFDFTNTYGVEPVTASVTDSLKATKILTGRNAALATDEFSFELLEGDEVVATGKNDASGNIAMSAITYTEPGTHTYTLREVDAGTLKDGVTYSSESYEVQAVVSDNGDGTLSVAFSRLEQADDGDAGDEGTSDTGDTEGTGGDGNTGDATDESADSTDAAMTFTNTYKVSGPASVKLGASKTLTGRTIEDGEFSFELVDESGNVVQTVKNVGNAVNFEALEFSEAGKYTYMMKEVQGSASGITYDSSVYTATITVTDNDKGALEVEVAFSTDDGTAPVFSNTYKAASSTASTSSTTSSANKTTSSSNSTAQTGDSTSIALFAAMFAIAMCCIAVALVRKRNDRLARSRCSQGKHSRR